MSSHCQPGKLSPRRCHVDSANDICLCRELTVSSLGVEATEVVRLAGGRNSRVYRVCCGLGREVVVKFYPPEPEGKSVRMDRELRALEFLNCYGVEGVVQLLARDDSRRAAVLGLAPGLPNGGRPLATEDVNYAVEFLASLQRLRLKPEADSLSRASEAVFSLKELEANLLERQTSLAATAAEWPVVRQMLDFLENSLAPFREQAMLRATDLLDMHGWGANQSLPHEWRILSPSDFGFHNAVLSSEERWTFLDLEHFGWDDPVKTISDFCLHPAMQLAEPLRRRFRDSLIDMFDEDWLLIHRLRAVFPLFGVKWCLILLNEFKRRGLHRRSFAAAAQEEPERLLENQLEKAEAMLHRAKEAYDHDSTI